MQVEEKQHFSDIAAHSRFFNLPEPENPLFSVYTYMPTPQNPTIACIGKPVTFLCDFYTIALKKVVSGEISYGLTKYDCKNGSMLFTAPRQELTINGLAVHGKSTYIRFHEDFIKGHELRERIRKYNFFSYAVKEALHLSPKEDRTIRSIMENIEAEYQNNTDEFSKEIILAHLDTLLKYANRFYKRQFLDRKEISGELLGRFEDILFDYFASGKFREYGLPKIDLIARELHVSPRYLSDTLKMETGKTAIEHIHLYLIDEAKNLLHDSNYTVSQIAYKLGFDYPQYFSRLFKKKVGCSPKMYRELLLE